MNGSNDVLNLDNGSIMMLLPEDETPKEINGMLYKTKHISKFLNDGMSIGFVFCSMKESSVSTFSESTNEWAPEYDPFFKTTARRWQFGKRKHITEIRTSQLRKRHDVVQLCRNIEEKVKSL